MIEFFNLWRFLVILELVVMVLKGKMLEEFLLIILIFKLINVLVLLEIVEI